MSHSNSTALTTNEEQPAFPEQLLLNEPGRGARLVAEFYQEYHASDQGEHLERQHFSAKAAFFRERLTGLGHSEHSLGIDLGCRLGNLIRAVGVLRWLGVDVDKQALERARQSGIPCAQMDFTVDIGLRNHCVDALMMTEVLEHLPYPPLIVREVHRVLTEQPASAFLGSVPLDYHLHRRWKVLRGKRLSGDQTHVHHFSFHELDGLLRFYFDNVDYLPLSGTAVRHPWVRSWPNLFIRDIAWVASSPKAQVDHWNLGKL